MLGLLKRPLILNLSRAPIQALQQQHPDIEFRDWRSDLFALNPDTPVRTLAIITDSIVGLPFDLAPLVNLKHVVSVGSGVDVFDLSALKKRTIQFTPLHGIFAPAVARHALFFNSELEKRGLQPARDIGILGMGTIGKILADHFHGLGLTVRYRNRRKVASSELEFSISVNELAEKSDVLFLCCPGGPETERIVSSSLLKNLGPRGRLINVARGSVVDSEALYQALDTGEIAGAGLDVFSGTPELRLKLDRHPKVVMTDHIAWKSPTAMRDVLSALEGVITAQVIAERRT